MFTSLRIFSPTWVEGDTSTAEGHGNRASATHLTSEGDEGTHSAASDWADGGERAKDKERRESRNGTMARWEERGGRRKESGICGKKIATEEGIYCRSIFSSSPLQV